jgi:hypothetical protein
VTTSRTDLAQIFGVSVQAIDGRAQWRLLTFRLGKKLEFDTVEVYEWLVARSEKTSAGRRSPA